MPRFSRASRLVLGLIAVLLGAGLAWGLLHRRLASVPRLAEAAAGQEAPTATAASPLTPAAGPGGVQPVHSSAFAPAAAPRLLGLDTARAGRLLGAVEDRWATATTLAEGIVPDVADPDLRHRVRLIRTDFKYPLLRVEETFRRDSVTGADTLLAQVAMAADHVLLKAAPGANEPALLASLTSAGGTVLSLKPAARLYLATVPAPLELDGLPSALEKFQALAGVVAYAEPDFVVHATLTPDDASYALLYGLHNTGQTGGVADADIDAPEAWEITTGSRAVRVGVIDTGIDYTHPDLAANIWTNPGEIPGNNVDDDGNGYVDDVRGWDFANNDNDPRDDHYHGTHCAGTIGAVGGNGLGVVGVNWQVSLVALKFLNASGSGTTSDAVEAVAYATRLGLDLTSNSWGGGGYSQALHDAIAEAGAAGHLFVAAAGNSGRNTDASVNYPSGYDLPNIIAVAATDHADQLAYFSNYGIASVDLAAPGVDTYSTAPGALYRTLSGTSMATPHVAGAAALVLSEAGSMPGDELKSILLGSVDPVPALVGKTLTGGRLNVRAALAALDDLIVSPRGGWAATVSSTGPLAADSATYTLGNRSAATIGWSAELDVPWARLSVVSGAVLPGASSSLQVTLLPSAVEKLPPGQYTGTLRLTDLASQRQQTRTVSLTVYPPPVFTFDLDTDPGWPRTGQWAYGAPQGLGGFFGNPDPTSGYTGTRVLGVNLGGDYSITPGGPYTLTAGPFNLTGYAATRLQFRRWLNSDYEPWVSVSVEISTDGAIWSKIWTNADLLITDGTWVFQDIDLSAYADNQPQVFVRWSYTVHASSGAWGLSGWNLDDIAILGQPPRLAGFDPLPPVREDIGGVVATLRFDPPPETPVLVEFASSHPGLIPAPASRTVAAGTTTLEIPLTVLDDSGLNGTRLVRITPTASGHRSVSLDVSVRDDEVATLSLSLPGSGVEGGTVSATVGLDADAATPVVVALSSDFPEVALPPASVLIPAGARMATFQVALPDNTRLGGPRTASLAASVEGWTSGRAAIAVEDNDARTLALSLISGLAEGSGTVADGGTVSLSGTLGEALTVYLSSMAPDQLEVPASVVIPAGARSVRFPLVLPDDAELDGVRQVKVSATAETFEGGSATVAVADNDPASFGFATVPSPQFQGQAFSATVRALDIDGEPALGFTGTAVLSGARAGQPASVSPAETGAFSAGTWTGALVIPEAGATWTVRVSRGAAAGVSNVFEVRKPVVQIVTLTNNDLVYDPGTDRIYASTPSGTVVPVNPGTGALEPAITVGGTPATLLARASDGSQLWVVHDDDKQIRAIALPGLSPGNSFNLGTGSNGQTYARDIVALPGSPATVVVSRYRRGLSPEHDGVAVYDDGVRRPTTSPDHTGSNTIEAGATAGRIFGFNNESTEEGSRRLQVTAGGISQLEVRGSIVTGTYPTIHADGDMVASNYGRIYNGETYRPLAALPYYGPIRPDLATNRIYSLSNQGGSVYRLRAFDARRFTELGSIDVPGVSGTPGALFRAGAGVLAFRTPTQVFLLNTTLVPTPDSANLRVTQVSSPNPAVAGQPLNYFVSVRNLGGGTADAVVLNDVLPAGATLVETEASQGTVVADAGTLTVALGALPAGAEATLRIQVTPAAGNASNMAGATSPTGDPDTGNNQSVVAVPVSAPATPALRRVALGARDLAYDFTTDRLLVTVGSSAPVFSNSLLRIEPGTLSIRSAEAVGDNPGRLKITSDGRFAHAILDGSCGIARMPVVAGDSTVLDFGAGFGASGFYRLQRALDFAAVNGRTDLVGVARDDLTARVALYQDGVVLPGIPGGITPTATLVDAATAQKLYGYGYYTSSRVGFYRYAVQSGGLAVEASKSDLITSTTVNRLKRVQNLVYTNLGQIIDPEALSLVASLGVTGPCEPVLDDEVLYILQDSTLRSYDLFTRAPQGTLSLGTLDGTPSNLVRCGGRSLAFVTSTGVLYRVEAPTLVPAPSLRVVLPARLAEGVGTVPGVGRLEILRPAPADIVVQLTTSAPQVLDITRNVILPAGHTSVTFDVTVTDNDGLNGTRPVVVTAATDSVYTPKPASVLVDDDETATLSLSIPASYTEGAATVAGQGTVTLSGRAQAPLSVTLSSSDTSELVVPAAVVIPAGAASATFTLSTPDDDLLDGTQTAVVTASVPGYTGDSKSAVVVDNEGRQLAIVLPATAKEGGSSVQATIQLPGKTLVPVTVKITVDDSSELYPGASTYQVQAGQDRVLATLYPQDDNLIDGGQPVVVTVEASGFITGSGTIRILDNEPAYGEWTPISGPQVSGTPFTVSFSLKTVDGDITIFSGNVGIEARSGGGGAVLQFAPVTMSGTISGVSTSSITVLTAGENIRLRGSFPGIPDFESNAFAVRGGPLARFGISPLASPQASGVPATVTITAQDAAGNPVTGFSGVATLSADAGPTFTGMDTQTWKYMFPDSSLSVARTQVIYTPTEVGPAGLLNGLALKVLTSPRLALPNWTIRLKQVNSTETTGWVADGWTTVYQGTANLAAAMPGWVEFPFIAPFTYDGTSNLLVDFSFKAASASSSYSGLVEGGQSISPRLRYTYSSSGVDPLTWSGSSPSSALTYFLPNLRFSRTINLPLSPSVTTAFAGGAWTGAVAFGQVSEAQVALRATQGSAVGRGNDFILVGTPSLLAEPPVTGGTTNTLAWTGVPGAVSYQVQASPDAGFPTARSSGWIASTSHDFSALAEGPWNFRIQARHALSSRREWRQTSYDDFAAGGLPLGTSLSSPAGSIALGQAIQSTVENFDVLGSALDGTLFSSVSGIGTGGRQVLTATGPATTPALPINRNTDPVAVLVPASGETVVALQPEIAANRFADSTIETVFATPDASTSFAYVRLLLRANRNAGTGLLNAYAAILSCSSYSQEIGVDFARITDGYNNSFGIYSNQAKIPLVANENIRVRFSVTGSKLSLRAWRIGISNGAVVETPVLFGNFASYGPELSYTDTSLAVPGVAGFSVYGGTAFFEDVRVTPLTGGAASNGRFVSSVIQPATRYRWGALNYAATRPAGTSLTVDVLDASGNAILASGVASGSDLGAIPAVASAGAIRLQAGLSSSIVGVTPLLDEWSVAYESAPPADYIGPWSLPVASIQDATAPSIALTSPLVSTTAAYTLSGSASDANGVATLSVNGLPVSVSGGPAGWSRLLNLRPGANALDLIVSDVADPANTRAVSFVVTYNPPAPPPDTDSDGLPDAWEQAHGLNPASGSAAHGRLGDPDGDGLPNLLEYAFGGDPQGPDSNFAEIGTAPGEITGQSHLLLRYRRLISPGTLTYRVLTSANLTDWAEPATPPELLSVTPHPDGVTETVVLRLHPALGSEARFVRIQVDAP